MLRKHNGFEEALRKKLENQIAVPPKTAWSEIKKNLEGSDATHTLFYHRLVISILLFLLILGGTAAFIFNNKLNSLEHELIVTKAELQETSNRLTEFTPPPSGKDIKKERTAALIVPDKNKHVKNKSNFISLGETPYRKDFPEIKTTLPSSFLAFSSLTNKEPEVLAEEEVATADNDKIERKENEKSRLFSFYATAGKNKAVADPNLSDNLIVKDFNSDDAYHIDFGTRYILNKGDLIELYAGAGILFQRNDYHFQASTNEVDHYEVTSLSNKTQVNTVYKSTSVSADNWSLMVKPEAGVFYRPRNSNKWVSTASVSYVKSLIQHHYYKIDGLKVKNQNLRNENIAFSLGLYRTYLSQNQAKFSAGPSFSGFLFSTSKKESPVILRNYSAGFSLLLELQ